LYIYNTSNDPAHLKLHTLQGGFIMLDNPIPISNFGSPYLYPITIIFGT